MKATVAAALVLASFHAAPAPAQDALDPIALNYSADSLANPYNRFGSHNAAALDIPGLHSGSSSSSPARFGLSDARTVNLLAWQIALQPQPPQSRVERVARMLRHRTVQFWYTFKPR
jgi:hypothetical protein